MYCMMTALARAPPECATYRCRFSTFGSFVVPNLSRPGLLASSGPCNHRSPRVLPPEHDADAF